MSEAEGAPMTDYYEVLSVDVSSTTDEIRAAYKKAAIKYHPDRNHGNVESATTKFKEVQRAYAVLSDPEERAWYDSHKNAILRGEDDGTCAPDEINLFDFLSTSCYKGFGDGANSFFTVYQTVFSTITNEEVLYVGRNDDGSLKTKPTSPPFGSKDASYADVNLFYQFWTSFYTKKTFAWKDEYKTNEIPDRASRRQAERINQKARDRARREYNKLVQELILHVMSRDPRVTAEKERQEEEDAKKSEEKAKQMEELARKRRETDRKFYEELARKEMENEAADPDGDCGDRFDELFERQRQAEAQKKAEAAAEKAAASSEAVELYCASCDKHCESSVAYAAHCNSKKHKLSLRTEKRTDATKTQEAVACATEERPTSTVVDATVSAALPQSRGKKSKNKNAPRAPLATVSSKPSSQAVVDGEPSSGSEQEAPQTTRNTFAALGRRRH